MRSPDPHSSEWQLMPLRQQLLHKLRPFRGVTFYKRTGRWEANLWYENKQHYLGASYTALEAAKAYDIAILFTRSCTEQLNFDPSDYTADMQKVKGMSFLQCRQYLRDRSQHANCHVVNNFYKGILIDQNGKWEVKYCLKNQRKQKYVLVGWYDTEDTALRAYNETALEYDGPRAIIKSFHGRQDIRRSLRKSRSPYDVPTARIDMEVVSNLASGEEPVLSDAHSASTCNPGFEEQLPQLVAPRAPVSREEIHTNGVNSECLAPRLEPLKSVVQENEVLIRERAVPPIEEPPSLCFVQLLGTNKEGPSRSCNTLDFMQLSERREYHPETSDYWILHQYEYHWQNGGVVYHSHLIHNFFQVHPPHCDPSLNEGVVTAATGAVDLSHLKTNAPFHIDLSLSLNN